MAVLVLTAQRKLHYDYFLFANVGDDSEEPGTLHYLEEYAKPYAEEFGIQLIEARKTMADGTPETVLGRIERTRKSVVIPAYMNNSAPARRVCTSDFKVGVIAKWLKEHGATADNPATTGLGISLDEMQRMKTDSGIAWQVLEYPLIDLRLSRHHCEAIIAEAGLPVPPKSACWFCPHHKVREWRQMAIKTPELFAKACAVEELINAKYKDTGDTYHLHRSKRPLSEVVATSTADMFEAEDDNCESGYCMT